MRLVLFGAVRQTEFYLTSSVRFGQNGKTPLRSVTNKVKNHPPTGSRVLAEHVHSKKVSENNKKGKYLLGLGFLLNDVNIFPKKLFGIFKLL